MPSLWKSGWRLLRILEVHLTNEPTVSVLVMYVPKGLFILPQKYLLIHVNHISFKIVQGWKQYRYPSVQDQIIRGGTLIQ